MVAAKTHLFPTLQRLRDFAYEVRSPSPRRNAGRPKKSSGQCIIPWWPCQGIKLGAKVEKRSPATRTIGIPSDGCTHQNKAMRSGVPRMR